MLSRFDRGFFLENIRDREARLDFPRVTDREKWEALKNDPFTSSHAEAIITNARKLKGKEYPVLRATHYAEYKRSGNRNIFEKPYFERRVDLATLTIAECLENNGEFTESIFDLLHMISEEYTWTISAHAVTGEKDLLQSPKNINVDLFSSETALAISRTLYLLEDKIMALSPTLVDRLKQKIVDEVITPVAKPESCFWWFTGNNNWTPWCCANILQAATAIVEDREFLSSLIVEKLNPAIEKYIEKYPEDGACDEGPSYWQASPAHLFNYAVSLATLTGKKDSEFLDSEKFPLMCKYFVAAQLGDNYVANFADGLGRMKALKYGAIARMAEIAGNDELYGMILKSYENNKHWQNGVYASGTVEVFLQNFFYLKQKPVRECMSKKRSEYFDKVQLVFARDRNGAGEEICLAAKAGNNHESHNHNDIGQFIIAKNGLPLILDPGTERYTRQTFTPEERYKIWANRSLSHNVPIIGGHEQVAGETFKATNVSFEKKSEHALHFSMELKEAYEKDTGIKNFVRSIDFADCHITVTDKYELEKDSVIDLHLLSLADEVKQSERKLELGKNGETLCIEFSQNAFAEVKVSRREITDDFMAAGWQQDYFTEIHFTTAPADAGEYELKFS